MAQIRIAANAVNARALEIDDDVKLELSELLSYQVAGAEHSQAFKSGSWSGRSTLFGWERASFPAGLVNLVVAHLKQKGHSVSLIRAPAPEPLNPEAVRDIKLDPFGYTGEYDYQYETVDRLVKHRAMIAQCATGCHAAGQGIVMFDGSIKRVEEIVVGDLLMGVDSTPRRVLNLHRGSEEMFKITPNRGGDSFVVNRGHILSLELTNTGKSNNQAGEWVNVSVGDYLRWGVTQRHIHKLHRSRGVDFSNQVLPIDPYALGVLLGDGYIKRSVSFTTMDSEVLDAMRDFAAARGASLTKYAPRDSEAVSYGIVTSRNKVNPILDDLRDLGLLGCGSEGKFIPDIYKTSSRNDRLAMIAGLIDTDGHLHNNGFDFVSKSKQLASDLAFVARSLGFAVNTSTKTISAGKYAGNVYHRVSINGDITTIPVRIARKRPTQRGINKDHCRTGFTVESVGVGDYYGFEVNGDNLYLLEDFTVTHNSGKSRIGCLAFAKIKRPTLFITTRSVLMHQMKRAFDKSIDYRRANGEKGLEKVFCGVMGDSEWKLSPHLNVAMVQTIQAKLKDPRTHDQMVKILEHFEFVILEEAHESSGEGYYTILNACKNAVYRLALTATPFMREDEEANMRLMAVSGPIGIRVTEKELIDKGILATPQFKIVSVKPDPKVRKSSNWQLAYKYGIVLNAERNQIIVDEVAAAVKAGLSCMVLVQRREHGEILERMLRAAHVRTKYIFGDSDQETRQKALDDLRDGRIDALIGSTIMDVGVDVPAVGMVALAGAGKAEVALRQRIGRGLRRKPKGMENRAYILEFRDQINKHLIGHSEQRRQILESTPGFAENILPHNADFSYKEKHNGK